MISDLTYLHFRVSLAGRALLLMLMSLQFGCGLRPKALLLGPTQFLKWHRTGGCITSNPQLAILRPRELFSNTLVHTAQQHAPQPGTAQQMLSSLQALQVSISSDWTTKIH